MGNQRCRLDFTFGGLSVGRIHLIRGTLNEDTQPGLGSCCGHGELEGWLSKVDRVGFGFGGPDVGKVHFRS